MYFDFKTFFRMAYLSFFKAKNSAAPLTPKRFIVLVLFFAFFSLFQVFNAICFGLDNIFFPGWRKIELEPPVFIIGNPRSGTTFMHRLLAQDKGRFFFFLAWEIFAPSIIQKKVLSLFGRIDRNLLGNFCEKKIRKIEANILTKFNKIHKTGLFYPEECETLLFHIFSTYNILFLFPFEGLGWFDQFDIACPPKHRKRIMTFYLDCVKRQAYFKGNKAQLLSKSPGFTPKVQSLLEYFPGCKIIYMARNPLQVIPSTLNIVSEIWKSANLKPEPSNLHKAYEMVKFYYSYPLSFFEKIPLSTYHIVNYENLVKQPSQVVCSIYEHFGFTINERYKNILEKEDEKAKAYKSSHSYSLDQFAYTHDQIISDFKEIFQRFSFRV